MTKEEAALKEKELQDKKNLDLAKAKQLDKDGNIIPKTYSEDEYKNLQSFSTKVNQEKIAIAEKLVKSNPKELLDMDSKLQLKVIENVYGVSSLEELKIMSPELFTDKKVVKGWDEDDEMTIMKKKIKLMEYKSNEWAIAQMIENIQSTNKDVADTIPDFAKEMKIEMANFWEALSYREKAERAFKLLAGSTSASNDAYLAMQGKTIIKSKWTSDYSNNLENSPLAQAMKRWRRK